MASKSEKLSTVKTQILQSKISRVFTDTVHKMNETIDEEILDKMLSKEVMFYPDALVEIKTGKILKRYNPVTKEWK